MKNIWVVIVIALLSSSCVTSSAEERRAENEARRAAKESAIKNAMKARFETPSNLSCNDLKLEIKSGKEALELASESKFPKLAQKMKVQISLLAMYGGQFASNRFYHYRHAVFSRAKKNNKQATIDMSNQWIAAGYAEAREPRNNCGI